jgi:hypothetical protein
MRAASGDTIGLWVIKFRTGTIGLWLIVQSLSRFGRLVLVPYDEGSDLTGDRGLVGDFGRPLTVSLAGTRGFAPPCHQFVSSS